MSEAKSKDYQASADVLTSSFNDGMRLIAQVQDLVCEKSVDIREKMLLAEYDLHGCDPFKYEVQWSSAMMIRFLRDLESSVEECINRHFSTDRLTGRRG